jgi:hypothetical protein
LKKKRKDEPLSTFDLKDKLQQELFGVPADKSDEEKEAQEEGIKEAEEQEIDFDSASEEDDMRDFIEDIDSEGRPMKINKKKGSRATSSQLKDAEDIFGDADYFDTDFGEVCFIA